MAALARTGTARVVDGVARTEKNTEKYSGGADGQKTPGKPTAGTIPTYVHVVHEVDGTGFVSQSDVAEQIAVLNLSFAGFPDGADTGFRFTLAGGVLVGIERGRLDRSTIPAGPSARNLAAHFRAVGGEVMNIFAAAATGQCSSTMSLASRRRARGVRAALAWDTKASCVREAVLRQLHSRNGRPSPRQQNTRDSGNNVPGHHS